MATVKKLLDVARKELGYKESPPNSNKTKYGKWMGLDGYPWCMSFIQFCCNQADVHLPMKTGSCTALMNAAKQADMWVTSNFCPGDIAIFDFTGKQKVAKHCGIVEDIIPDYGIVAIEGNTSSTDAGSQDNGGMVCRKRRQLKHIIGVVRPQYAPEKSEEDVSDMTIAEFVDKLTDEQAYMLLTKAQRYAGTLSEPEWSIREGHWARAKNNGTINGGNPEGLIKRDEVIAILGRRGLV